MKISLALAFAKKKPFLVDGFYKKRRVVEVKIDSFRNTKKNQ